MLFKKYPIHVQVTAAMFLGLAAALVTKTYIPNAFFIPFITFLGEIFIKLLKMIVVPLIATSIIASIGALTNSGSIKRLALKTILYYTATTFLAITIGLAVVNIIQPGSFLDVATMTAQELPSTLKGAEMNSITDVIMNLVPANPFKALANGDMLALIFFSIIFGMGIHQLDKFSKGTITSFFEGVYHIMLNITMVILRFTPVGVFALIFTTFMKHDWTVIIQLFGFAVTVIIGLSLHMFVALPALVFITTQLNPFKFLHRMATPLLTAFSTASSAATLPLTLETTQEEVKISPKVSSFVLPIGATINMDGTALFECVAVIFIAQALGVDLTVMQQVMIVITALLASVGAAGIPMAGLVMMVVIMETVGLPIEAIGLIIGIDRILDMYRTMVNVWSDSCGALVVAVSEGEQITL